MARAPAVGGGYSVERAEGHWDCQDLLTTDLSSRPSAARAGKHRDAVGVEKWVPDSASRFRDDKL